MGRKKLAEQSVTVTPVEQPAWGATYQVVREAREVRSVHITLTAPYSLRTKSYARQGKHVLQPLQRCGVINSERMSVLDGKERERERERNQKRWSFNSKMYHHKGHHPPIVILKQVCI